MEKINEIIIQYNKSIKQAIKQIDKGSKKIVFVVDEKDRLIGSLSDGDIRRWILKTGGIDGTVKKVANKNPIYVNADHSNEYIKNLMLKKSIENVPVLDEEKRIIDLLSWDGIFSENKKRKFNIVNLPVVIMAGGKGTRLDPFTRILPKPLIPIGEKPIIEIIMDEYAKFGMTEFYFSINYKAKMIKAYFEDFKSDYKIKYIEEDKPLGTAGALKYLEGKISTPFFVSNCDIIIDADCSKIYEFHKKGKYSITLVASMQHHKVPYGVCQIENGGILKEIKEKPEYDILVNTGMYILNPEVLQYIPKNKFYHITHLIEKIKIKGYQIGVYPVSQKSWIDVGQWGEYNKLIKSY